MSTPNALFAILNVSDTTEMKSTLEQIAPWVSYELQEGQWLLVAPAAITTKEVSEKLGLVGSGKNITGLVLKVDNYFGRNYQAVWDWISTKQGAELVVHTSA